MIEALNNFCKFISIPYFLILMLSLACLYKSNHKVFLYFISFILFSIIWRVICRAVSPRYFLIILLYIFLLLLYSSSKIHSKKSYIITSIIFLCLILYNLISTFSSFRNTYYIDLQKDILCFLKNNNASVFIDSRDFNRIRSSYYKEKQFSLPHESLDIDSLDTLKYQYPFWEEDGYVLLPTNSNINSKTDGFPFKRIRRYISNKNKTKDLSVLYSSHKILLRTIPDFNSNPFVSDLYNHGTLKSCNIEHDIYVIQSNDKLFWLIGKPLNDDTEIIFHIFTNRPELLPLNRQVYGFDNRGFRFSSKNCLGYFDRFKVFERPIPQDYPITHITVGTNSSGNIVRMNSFAISN